jgi:parvulin-like peptidyl-prolyl isomerase
MAPKEKKAHEETNSELLHRFKSHPFLFIGSFLVLILIIVAFVLVPAIVPEYGRRGNVDLTFGYYDKIPITYVPGNYFAQYYEMVYRYRQNTMDSENLTYMGYQIWREAYEAAVIHTAILQEMKNAGYSVPVKRVDREVAQLPQFQENGRFSSTLYKRMNSNERLALWRQVQEEITERHFRSDGTGLLKPSAEAEFIGRMEAVQRSFQMTVFNVDAYPEEEYEAYAREHSDQFRSARLSMITISSSEREARQVLDSIKNGETTFEDAARAHSKDMYADRGGDMGMKIFNELNVDIPEEETRDIVISLAKGDYSNVIKTAAGWFFFRCEEAAQEADLSDPVVMEKVKSYMRNFERGRMENWAIDKANEFIALVNEYGFDEALSLQELPNRSFGPVPINYGNVDLFTTLQSQSVPELAGSAENENFWKAAFSTPVGEPSQWIVQGSNVLVLFPVEEIEVEASRQETVASTYSEYWLDYMIGQSMQQSFMNSPKMTDKFMDTYFRFFIGNNVQGD